MQKNVVVCDACGVERSAYGPGSGRWLKVQSAVSSEEYQALAAKVAGGANPELLLDNGDFCSLECLANWASARANMRSLDEDMGDDGLALA